MTTASARLGANNGGGRVIDPTPAVGYAGAAAVDPQGRLLGMVELKPSLVANGGAAAPQPRAVVVPVETMRTFLHAENVTPAAGAASLETAKASVVRVICVRK